MPAPWWFQGAAGMAGAALGGGSVAALIQTRSVRRTHRDDAVATDIREAQDCLKALRRTVKRRLRNPLYTIEPERLDDLVTDLQVAADRTGSDRVVRLTYRYVDLAERLGIDDEDIGQETEQAAYAPLAAALREALNRRR